MLLAKDSLRKARAVRQNLIYSKGKWSVWSGDTILMEEHQNPEKRAESGKDHLRVAAGDLKEAASAKAEDIRQAAGQKVDALREVAEATAQELRGAAESAWADARNQSKSWQAQGEVYIRNNPFQAVCIALGLGFVLGLLLRK
jgi:ElaB/YqjD/DUF883 family membrane-anchored ribosome-binding protein